MVQTNRVVCGKTITHDFRGAQGRCKDQLVEEASLENDPREAAQRLEMPANPRPDRRTNLRSRIRRPSVRNHSAPLVGAETGRLAGARGVSGRRENGSPSNRSSELPERRCGGKRPCPGTTSDGSLQLHGLLRVSKNKKARRSAGLAALEFLKWSARAFVVIGGAIQQPTPVMIVGGNRRCRIGKIGLFLEDGRFPLLDLAVAIHK